MKPRREPTLDGLLRGTAPPQPPAELRARVLDAAREAALRHRPPDLWSSLWSNRGLRAAWVGGVALLLAAHAALSVGSPGSRRAGSSGLQARHSNVAAVGELADAVRISADARPNVGRAAPGQPLELELKGDPS